MERSIFEYIDHNASRTFWVAATCEATADAAARERGLGSSLGVVVTSRQLRAFYGRTPTLAEYREWHVDLIVD